MENRGPDGRFLPGKSGNEGNTGSTYKARMLAVVKDAVTADDWKTITERAVLDAVGGDHNARQWLSNYCLGKPEENMPLAVYPITIDEWYDRVEERQNDSES